MICILKVTKEHNSVYSVSGVTSLVLCTSSDNVFLFVHVLSFAKESQRVSGLQTQTVGSTLGCSQMLKDGRKTGSLYRAMPEAGSTKRAYQSFTR